MGLDRTDGDEKLGGDFLIGVLGHDQFQHLLFAAGEFGNEGLAFRLLAGSFGDQPLLDLLR